MSQFSLTARSFASYLEPIEVVNISDVEEDAITPLVCLVLKYIIQDYYITLLYSQIPVRPLLNPI